MTELETMQFYKILELVQKDLAHLRSYDRDFERVRSAANGAVLYNDIFQYNNIMERIHTFVFILLKIYQYMKTC